MHIPDGFLDTKTWSSLAVASGAVMAVALSGKAKRISEEQVPLMGVAAAFIFAAQMINLPVAGGTSGHFMGAMLAAILLGPWAAFLIMATVLIVQCLVFQDGGLLALGANIFNMGVVAVGSGWLVYNLAKRSMTTEKWWRIGSFSGAWISIVLSAAVVAVELSLSGAVALRQALPAMVGVHAIIGLVEGVITLAVLEFIYKVRPDLLTFGGAADE